MGRFHPQIDSDKRSAPVALHVIGDSRPLTTLSAINGDFTDVFAQNRTLPVEYRYHFIPDAKIFVVVAPQADKIEVHKLDVDETLEKAGIDYLFVASSPPGFAVKNKDYRYDVGVRSKKGGVTYKVESGPDGMKIANNGTVTWKVPADQAEAEVNVILTVADKTGQEVFHTFSVSIVDKAPADAAIAAPAPKVEPKAEPKKPDAKKEPEPPVVAAPPVKVAPNSMAIKPPVFDGDKVERETPATIDNIVLGGGGRFVFLNLPTLRKIAVFDVNEAKIVKYVPTSGDNPFIAAGLDKLVIAYKETRILQRWSLETFEREVSVPIDIDRFNSMFMGSASHGPIVIGSGDPNFGGGVTLLDLKTLKPIGEKVRPEGGLGRNFSNYVRASADGTVFGLWYTGSPTGLQSVVLVGNQLKPHYEHTSVGHVAPSPDGRFLYTASGIYTNECKPLHNAGRNGDGNYCLPAAHGDYYLKVNFGGDRGGRNGKVDSSLSVHIAGDTRQLLTIPFNFGIADRFDDRFGFDRRLIMVPAANLLLYVPPTNDRIVAHRLDIDKALEKSDVDYLFVTTRAPGAAKGRDWTYPVGVKSRKGGVTYRLESGPEGMAVAKNGVMTWKVPADFAAASADVILTVSDVSGQEVFHVFKIAVGDAPAAAPKETK